MNYDDLAKQYGGVDYDLLASQHGGSAAGSTSATVTPPSTGRSFFDPRNIFPGEKTGQAIGTIAGYGLTKASEATGLPVAPGGRFGFHRARKGESANYDLSAPTPLQVGGDVIQGAALVGGLKAPVPSSGLSGARGIASRTAQAVGQYGALSGVSGVGVGLEKGETGEQIVDRATTAAAIGAGTGGAFNLLGEGVSYAARRFGPTTLSFTSGVPREAISQAASNPKAAKTGLKMPVSEVREKAVASLRTLKNDLSKEFERGLDDVVSKTGQTKKGVAYNQQGFIKSAGEMQRLLTEYGRSFAREFRIGTKKTSDGVVLDFARSPIVKPGEKANVQEVFRTISTWDDFSARGVQNLAERVGALRKFESGAKTESSAIISKIYNKIAGTGGAKSHALITKFYPELATVRTNFAKNKRVLDAIDEVLSAEKTNPKDVQTAITRLDNIFRDNRDVYVNVVKQLGDRSGVDYLSMLAGGEFQRLLPDFVRGFGGGGAVSVGASVLNPWLILLTPLFSPRFTGLVTRNASGVADASSRAARVFSSQLAPRIQGN